MDKRLWLITTGYPGIVGHVTRAPRSSSSTSSSSPFLKRGTQSYQPLRDEYIHLRFYHNQYCIQAIQQYHFKIKEFLYSRQNIPNISNVNTIGKFILDLLNVQYIIDNSSSWWIDTFK